MTIEDMTSKEKITGIIISGGKSSRMGEEKAFINYHGKPLIKHVIDLISPYCDEIIISANKKEYENLGYKTVCDTVSNIGPIIGIHNSLKECYNNSAIIIACDTPNITPEIIELLIANMQPDKITIPIHNNLLEPLCAIYPKACVDHIKLLIEKEKYKLQNLPLSFPSTQINIDKILELTPNALDNFNTKEDLQQ